MYTVHKERYGYGIAKWSDDSNWPVDLYSITDRGCSCPAGYRRRRCKHFKLIDAFKELEPGAWAFEFRGDSVQPIHLALLDIE